MGVKVAAAVLSRLVQPKPGFFLAQNSRDDLLTLTVLVEAGKVTPVIDRTFPLGEAPAAIRYASEGHPPAKVVITIPRAER